MPKPHHKKLKYKDSKITLTDRNKSSQLKNDINTYPYNNSNLTEYIKFNKKNSIKSIKNIKKILILLPEIMEWDLKKLFFL